ncbi:unnamed protein product [Alopecurus aequalis]
MKNKREIMKGQRAAGGKDPSPLLWAASKASVPKLPKEESGKGQPKTSKSPRNPNHLHALTAPYPSSLYKRTMEEGSMRHLLSALAVLLAFFTVQCGARVLTTDELLDHYSDSPPPGSPGCAPGATPVIPAPSFDYSSPPPPMHFYSPPPPEVVPSPPEIVPSPPEIVYPPPPEVAPSPPEIAPFPGPPEVAPSPPEIAPFPGPPEVVPSPPEIAPFPGPPEVTPSPPEIAPMPPIVYPSPPDVVPYPPEVSPSPPEIAPFPGPPEAEPSPPEVTPYPGTPYVAPSPPEVTPFPGTPYVAPSPPEVTPFPGPPYVAPSPPEVTPFPGPPEGTPNPPEIVPSPPDYAPYPPPDSSSGSPSPPESSPGTSPSPPGGSFQAPVVFPPSTGPPSPSSGHGEWCVAKPSVPGPIVQQAMDYACASGADCDSLQPDGACFKPDTMTAHASYAFNSYWQHAKATGATCDFGGTAMLITKDPSYGSCHYSVM